MPVDAESVAGPLRFSQLRRRIAAVSQKKLTKTLRTLARNGLVLRTVMPILQVTVHYQFTSMDFRPLADIGTLKE